jgi:hypothetical protein
VRHLAHLAAEVGAEIRRGSRRMKTETLYLLDFFLDENGAFVTMRFRTAAKRNAAAAKLRSVKVVGDVSKYNIDAPISEAEEKHIDEQARRERERANERERIRVRELKSALFFVPPHEDDAE